MLSCKWLIKSWERDVDGCRSVLNLKGSPDKSYGTRGVVQGQKVRVGAVTNGEVGAPGPWAKGVSQGLSSGQQPSHRC